MYALNQIIRMNREAVEQSMREDNFSRHCSFAGNSQEGVVLHSAKHRNTVFLRGGRQAAAFLAAWWSVNSQEQRDHLVESYF
jgi:regulatory protein YycI of two-component signal transduction system YycFG